VRAVLAFNQAGVDRRRKRRVVQGHGQVVSPGLAGFLPRRTDVVTGGLQAEVRAVIFPLVVDSFFYFRMCYYYNLGIL